MVSKKVYQDRVSRGVCVRCGEDRRGSKTKQCLDCVAKAKTKRGAGKPAPIPEPEKDTPKETAVDPEQVVAVYGDRCTACCEGEMPLLRIVSNDPDKPEKRTFRQLIEHLTYRAATTGKWPSGYEVMCAACFRERAIVHAIKLEDLS